MNMLVHRRVVNLSLLTFVTIFTMAFSSCGYPSYVTDPASKTQGYRLFTGRTDGFQISFEYPNTWTRQVVENSEKLKTVNFQPPFASMSVSSYVTIANGGDFSNADELIQHEIDLNLNKEFPAPEFKIISQKNTTRES
jgi:hypothetical protein